MRFVLTGIARFGEMHVLRDDLIASAKDAGHYVDPRVTLATDYLITNYPDKQTRKRKDADKYGVPVISTQEFIELVGGKLELHRTLGMDKAS